MSARDVRDMTIRELGMLADDIRTLPRLSQDYVDASQSMALAALTLQSTGALAQLVWWQGVDPEPPPDVRGKIVEMSAR